MQITNAEPDNAPQIARIWHAQWHNAHAKIVPAALTELRSPEEFAARTRSHLGQTQIAWIDNEIAGFFMLDEDEIYQFYVAPSFQGTGAAAQLMTAAENALGAGLKWLACSVGNDRAARFYEKCGWIQAGTIPYEVETGEGPLTVEVWRYEKRILPEIAPKPIP